MLIATKNGWLISADLITETEKYWEVKAFDEPTPRIISKSDDQQQVFSDMATALHFAGAHDIAEHLEQPNL